MELKWPKRSHRDVNTYFAGYEKRETTDPVTGRRKTEYIYRGDYYIFDIDDETFRRFRWGSFLRVAAATGRFVAAHLLGPRGTVLPWLGIPALLSVIPLVYLWMGLAALLRTRSPRMTIREFAFGLERMENVLWILWILWAVAAGGEVVYLLIKKLFTAAELLAAGMEAAAFALALWQQVRQSKTLDACVHKPEAAGKNKKG